MIRGSVWTLAGYVATQGLRLASNLLLTRLLFPEAFGLMSLVQVFMQGLQMFSDVGIGPSLIQNKRGDDPDFVNTAWTIQVMRGAILAAGAVAISWPVASFYGEPALRGLLAVSGLSALLAGFTSSKVFSAQRHMALARLTVLDLGSQVVGIILMVLLALRFHSVWVLVIGWLSGALTRAVLSHALLPGKRNHFRWEPSSVTSLLTFGKWIFVSTFTTFLAAQSDRLIFGKMIPLDMLGVYGIAAMLAATPTQMVVKIGSSVIFPAYSGIVQAGQSLAGAMAKVRGTLILGGGALIAFFAASGPTLIDVLYDERYATAGVMLQVLSIGAWFQILECTNGSALLALGHPRWVAAGNIAKLVGLVLFIPAGYWLRGFPGALGGLVASDGLKYFTAAIGVTRRGLGAIRGDMMLTLGMAATSGALFVVGAGVRQVGGGDGMVLLASATLAGALALVPAVRMVRQRKAA